MQSTDAGASTANNDEIDFAALQAYNDRVRNVSQQVLPGFGNLAPTLPTEISDSAHGSRDFGISEFQIGNSHPATDVATTTMVNMS